MKNEFIQKFMKKGWIEKKKKKKGNFVVNQLLLNIKQFEFIM